MRKKIFRIITILVVLFQSFSGCFIYTEAANNTQPATCNGPSETMSNYFNFQRESIKILLGSEVNSARFSASFGPGGLFTNRVLTLNKENKLETTAIDLLRSSIAGNSKAFISNSTTTLVLFTLASLSVVQSNTEGLAILYQDRPIVRDYKEMLDIETELFEVAYYRSKQINMISPLEGNLFDEYEQLIEKYKGLGLLDKNSNLENHTMSQIIGDLVRMNARMKHFIVVGDSLGKKILLGNNGGLKFSDEAVTQLEEEYKNVRTFGKCNAYGTYFKNTWNKTIDKNKDSLDSSMDDINKAMKRLKSALMSSNDGKGKNQSKNRCDISDYEMAQLQSYRGGGRTCKNNFFDVDISLSLLETDRYTREKQAQRKQSEKTENFTQHASKFSDTKEGTIGDAAEKLQSQPSTADRQQTRYEIYGNSNYNPEFSYELNSNFVAIFEDTMDQFSQSQENAVAAEISDLFPQGKGILIQVDTAIQTNNELQGNLKKVEKKQCSQ